MSRPTFRIWAGVDLTSGVFEWEDIAKKLPPKLLDADGDLNFLDDEANKKTCHGQLTEIFRSNDEVAGFGIEVFFASWEDGVSMFDSKHILLMARNALDHMRMLLNEWDLKWVEIDVYHTCDLV
jgi:hypothetical protein